MKDELEQLLRNLHLRKVAEMFDEELKRAEKQKLGHEEVFCRLLRAQWQRNQETALAYRDGCPAGLTVTAFTVPAGPPRFASRELPGHTVGLLVRE